MAKYGDIEHVRRALNHSNPTVTVLYALADQLVQTFDERRNLHRRKR